MTIYNGHARFCGRDRFGSLQQGEYGRGGRRHQEPADVLPQAQQRPRWQSTVGAQEEAPQGFSAALGGFGHPVFCLLFLSLFFIVCKINEARTFCNGLKDFQQPEVASERGLLLLGQG